MEKFITLLLISFLSSISNFVLAQSDTTAGVKIAILQTEITLEYQSAPRLSQAITEAMTQLDHAIYPLGVTLISPDKQASVDAKKKAIFSTLTSLNTPQAAQILAHLKKLHFVYKERTPTLLRNIRLNKNIDPLLTQNYALSLPIRPDFIRVITPLRQSSSLVRQRTNTSLKDYLTREIAGASYDSAWVIQADQKVRYISNIQWQNQKHYLSPGAIVFVGLTELPNQYKNLNQDIAELLSQHLEL